MAREEFLFLSGRQQSDKGIVDWVAKNTNVKGKAFWAVRVCPVSLNSSTPSWTQSVICHIHTCVFAAMPQS